MTSFHWRDPYNKRDYNIAQISGVVGGRVDVGYHAEVGDCGPCQAHWDLWVKWATIVLRDLPGAPEGSRITVADPAGSPHDVSLFVGRSDCDVGNSGWRSTSATKEAWLDAAAAILKASQ